MVSRQRQGFALARHHRPLSHLAERGDIAADAYRPGMGILGAVYAPFSHCRGFGFGERGRGAEALAGLGLLFACPQPACRRPSDSGIGTVPLHARRHQTAEGSGRLHRSSYCLLCFRHQGGSGGRQRISSAVAPLWHLHPHQLHAGQEGVCCLGSVAPTSF